MMCGRLYGDRAESTVRDRGMAAWVLHGREATNVTAVDLPRHSVSVAAVIVDRAERVMAVRRRDNGAWELPGGVLELREQIDEGLAREIREEAGVEVDVLRLSGVYKHIDRSIVSLVYHCRYKGDVATDWSETVGVRWMDRAEIADRMDRVFAARVFDALHGDPTVPAVRHHDGRSFLGADDYCLTVLNAYRAAPEPVKTFVRFLRALHRSLRRRPGLLSAALTLALVTGVTLV